MAKKLSSILIIEDSAPDQFLCKCIIEDYDSTIEIKQAYDGAEALDILRNPNTTAPDIILLDINMPRMDGFEFLDSYQDEFSKAHSAIIMFSSSNQQKDIDKSKQYQCVKGYVEKPCSPQSLAKIIALIE